MHNVAPMKGLLRSQWKFTQYARR